MDHIAVVVPIRHVAVQPCNSCGGVLRDDFLCPGACLPAYRARRSFRSTTLNSRFRGSTRIKPPLLSYREPVIIQPLASTEAYARRPRRHSTWASRTALVLYTVRVGLAVHRTPDFSVSLRYISIFTTIPSNIHSCMPLWCLAPALVRSLQWQIWHLDLTSGLTRGVILVIMRGTVRLLVSTLFSAADCAQPTDRLCVARPFMMTESKLERSLAGACSPLSVHSPFLPPLYQSRDRNLRLSLEYYIHQHSQLVAFTCTRIPGTGRNQ